MICNAHYIKRVQLRYDNGNFGKLSMKASISNMMSQAFKLRKMQSQCQTIFSVIKRLNTHGFKSLYNHKSQIIFNRQPINFNTDNKKYFEIRVDRHLRLRVGVFS